MSFNNSQVSVVVLAAGSGSRMQAEENKLFLTIRKIPVLYRTLYRMNQINAIDSIFLVCKAAEKAKIIGMIRDYGAISKLNQIVEGGPERSDSVSRGLKAVAKAQDEGLVMTHDGARPFITESLLISLLESVKTDTISIPALKVFETVRKKSKAGGNTSVVDRSLLYTVQTPQVFHIDQIQSCFLKGDNCRLNLTDEASYFEMVGKQVDLVEGEKWNIKLTTPDDIKWAEILIEHYGELKLEGLEN